VGTFFIISLLVGAGAWAASWWSGRLEMRGRAVDRAAVIPLAQLAEDAASVAEELGPGSFRQEVKIRGKIVCDAPLTSELSHTACVSYRFSVTREFEEVLWERDSQGNDVQRVRRGTETVASNEVSVPFWLDDGTSRILVDPDRAKVERTKTLDQFQPVSMQIGRVGSLDLNLSHHPGGTLGYRYEEHALAVGQEVTVVAEAGDEGGQLALRKPESKDEPFLVTTKGFQELSRSNRTLAAVFKGVSWGMAAVAVLIFLLGVIR
jgi:hypothetical protein